MSRITRSRPRYARSTSLRRAGDGAGGRSYPGLPILLVGWATLRMRGTAILVALLAITEPRRVSRAGAGAADAAADRGGHAGGSRAGPGWRSRRMRPRADRGLPARAPPAEENKGPRIPIGTRGPS